MHEKRRIVVAMSGGVDSSTAAAILKGQGHEVIGITLQLYDYGKFVGKKGSCCAGQDIYDAQVAAQSIGIPHYVFNYESIFKQQVIDDFADSYIKGETPIPCVRCNQRVKFRDLLQAAKNLGADSVATGHYVQKVLNNQISELHRGNDLVKDQSYFLFTTTQEQLDFLEFPVGHLDKSETRILAAKYGLQISDKPDSQDICFVPEGGYAKIVEKLRPEAFEVGDIVLKNGKVIGKHNGIAHYTIGQRKGINIPGPDPFYVLEIKPNLNQVIVGNKEDLKSCKLLIKEVNWLIEPGAKIRCLVKLRSAHIPQSAIVEPIDDGKAIVTLDEPYSAITPGQACVMYNGNRLIGGGWIISDKAS